MTAKRKKILLASLSAAAVLALAVLAWNPAEPLYRQIHSLPDANGLDKSEERRVEAVPALEGE